MLRKQYALFMSILKWFLIAVGVGNDKATGNCMLCQVYFFTNITCNYCPVYKRTGYTTCEYTPYFEWSRHIDKFHQRYYKLWKRIRCLQCFKLALKEMFFLISLILDTFKKGE